MVNSIVWFRQDLRIADNPALHHAVQSGKILPVYILDDINSKQWSMGEASRLWLHFALENLNKNLNNNLLVLSGDPTVIIPELITQYKITAIYWNRCYEPWRINRDKKIKLTLEKNNIKVNSYNSALLWEPWEVLKSDGTPYKVFTPFYRKRCLTAKLPREVLPKPQKIDFIKIKNNNILNQLKLLPSIKWDREIIKLWGMTESSAQNKLNIFIKNGLDDYKSGRDFPAKTSVSQLSPYLHFGQISPNQIWWEIKKLAQTDNTDCFLSELGWREFSNSLLYHFPTLPQKNLQSKFDNFPWQNNKKFLLAWQQGQTGYPIVDAGMRELWQTGYMHNRVRMIVGSFLVKNLLIHWHEGEKWFWDCLVDADLANNSASWQWIAGCGADAAPYFRIFNPVTQGEKFDSDGEYTKKYIPELKDLPNKYLFHPWDTPEEILKKANIKLGVDYPKPIIDLKISREQALAAYQTIRIKEDT